MGTINPIYYKIVVGSGDACLNENLLTIILALTVPFIGIYIGIKTKNMGRDEKYNRHREIEPVINNLPERKGEVLTKCTYCHKNATEKIPAEIDIDSKEQYFCSGTCKQEIIEYINEVKKGKGLFLGLILGSILIMVLANGIIIALKFDPQYMLFVTFTALCVIGIAIIKYPFTTPQTVQWLGIKKAKILAKSLGLATIVCGFVALTLGYLNYR